MEETHVLLRDFARTYACLDFGGEVVAIATLAPDADHEDLETFCRQFIPGCDETKNLAQLFQKELAAQEARVVEHERAKSTSRAAAEAAVLADIVPLFTAKHRTTLQHIVRPLRRKDRQQQPAEPKGRVEARTFLAHVDSGKDGTDPELAVLLKQRRELDAQIDKRQAALVQEQARCEAALAQQQEWGVGHGAGPVRHTIANTTPAPTAAT